MHEYDCATGHAWPRTLMALARRLKSTFLLHRCGLALIIPLFMQLPIWCHRHKTACSGDSDKNYSVLAEQHGCSGDWSSENARERLVVIRLFGSVPTLNHHLRTESMTQNEQSRESAWPLPYLPVIDIWRMSSSLTHDNRPSTSRVNSVILVALSLKSR